MNVHVHTEYVDGCVRCDLNRDEESADEFDYCGYQTHGGYLDPPEYCDAEIPKGDEFCDLHNRMANASPLDYADQAYEEARDRRLEEEDDRRFAP